MKRKRNYKKKAAGIAGAVIMAVGFISSTPVNAASFVQSAYMIDGAYASGSTGYTSSSVSANTKHKLHTTKEVSLTAYASYSGYYFQYNSTPVTGSAVDLDPVSVSVSIPSPYYGAGSKATHKVTGTTGVWSGSTFSGHYD